VLRDIVAVEDVLRAHGAALGPDAAAYRNHVYRVINLCLAVTPADADAVEKIAIAGVFHDLGIWTDRTFDYLEPSVRLAVEYLRGSDRETWAAEITQTIRSHHKISAARGSGGGTIVEPFRRADWIDVTRGARTFGLPRPIINKVFAEWPSAGFHRRLVELSLQRLRTHPLSPLPMLRF
jgi:hypothetical protein